MNLFREKDKKRRGGQAEAIVRAGLKRLSWTEPALAARPNGYGEKLRLAVRLRAETVVTVKWIAEHLRMGKWPHLNHLLYWHRRETSK